MNYKDVFISAIHSKNKVILEFNSYEKGVITRECVPYDYGPSNRYHDNRDRYHFNDLTSPKGNHTLSILPDQVISIESTNKSFDPADYITWTPNWIVPRDWGIYS